MPTERTSTGAGRPRQRHEDWVEIRVRVPPEFLREMEGEVREFSGYVQGGYRPSIPEIRGRFLILGLRTARHAAMILDF